MVRLLRSPRFVFAVLASGTAYCAVGAWLLWSLRGGAPAPAWAAALGLDHPFSAWPFLVAVGLFFASTLACTWGRGARTRAITRGKLPAAAVALAPRGADVRAFLEARGFRGRGEVLRRFAWALWGGWVLHVGLLVLVAAVLAQQAFHDTAAFDLTEGETARLSGPGVVFGRERGPFAPKTPPDLEVTLERFDPFLRQEGYAPDRLSRLAVSRQGHTPEIVTLDRAAGARVGSIDLYQAIPTGLAVNLEIAGMGTRSMHLAAEAEHVASARIEDPAGRPARVAVTTERSVADPAGTGRLLVQLQHDGGIIALDRGVPFSFGGREARVLSIGRWARFTYSRSPWSYAVFAGFAIILAGCALLAFPAGVARLGPPGSDAAAQLFQVRGKDAVLAEWLKEGTDTR
jgi:hypothetical protein